MAIILNDGLKINAGKPVDIKYLNSSNQPYTDIAEAIAAIPQALRYIGLTINIANIDYWWHLNVTDSGLVIKDSGLANTGITSAYNGLTKVGTAVKLGGTITGSTVFIDGRGAGNTLGLQYGGDYSGGYNLRSLVDAAYVTGKTGQILSIIITGATNGLGNTSQKICLGGTLITPTTISGTQLLTLGDLNGICLSSANNTDIALNAKSNGAIYLKSQSGSVASSNDTTNAAIIAIDYNGIPAMLVTDNTACPHGLVYATDYSNTYCEHSLVDKYYVDSVASGLNVHAAVAAATTTNVTLSGNSGTIDGINVVDIISTNNRILVKSQTNGALNGIYSASTGNWVRTEDYNYSPLGEISNGDIIPVSSGNTNANSQWILVTPNPITSGDTLTYSIFAQQFGITQGNGICVTSIGTNRNVAVKLSNSNPGLCFDSSSLEIDYNIFRIGLTCSVTTGKVDVRATVGSSVGLEIPVRIDSGGTNILYVDSSDFSCSLANNGLTKSGCMISLGGNLTGNTVINASGNCYSVINGSSIISNTCNSSTCENSTVVISPTCINFSILDNCNSYVFDVAMTKDSMLIGAQCNSVNTFAGITYQCNYCANYTNRSLVDKEYVIGALSTISAGNGLTNCSGTIVLGGNFTGDTAINLCGHNFSTDGFIKITGATNTSIFGTNLTASSTTVRSESYSLALGSSGAIFSDGNSGKGIEYATNYSTTFALHSLVDVNYVTGVTSNIKTNKYITTLVTSNITLDNTHYVILANSSGGTFTITLPSNPVDGQAYKIKDAGGDALTNNITISGNGKQIDSGSSATINTDYGALEFVYNSQLDKWFTLAFVN